MSLTQQDLTLQAEVVKLLDKMSLEAVLDTFGWTAAWLTLQDTDAIDKAWKPAIEAFIAVFNHKKRAQAKAA